MTVRERERVRTSKRERKRVCVRERKGTARNIMCEGGRKSKRERVVYANSLCMRKKQKTV